MDKVVKIFHLAGSATLLNEHFFPYRYPFALHALVPSYASCCQGQ